MEQCTVCETSFKNGHPLRLTMNEFGGDLLIYAQNRGRNIVFVRRIIVCRRSSSGWQSLIFFRDEGTSQTFVVGGGRIEPGSTQLKVRVSKGGATEAMAQAEYYEVPCRALTCNFRA